MLLVRAMIDQVLHPLAVVTEQDQSRTSMPAMPAPAELRVVPPMLPAAAGKASSSAGMRPQIIHLSRMIAADSVVTHVVLWKAAAELNCA